MTTLIEVRNSSGLVGRCDAKCYQADHSHCTCICGGLNHGAGLQQATDNTRELAGDWIERVKAANPKNAERIEAEIFGTSAAQLSMF